jgi:uncharacterized membrane protein
MSTSVPRAEADFPLHCESTATFDATVEQVFAYLDDFKALSEHMEKRSATMMGSRMNIAIDALGGRAVGSKVRMEGRVLGMRLSLDEVVTDRQPPSKKAWQTVDARLLVIGNYRLGFEIAPHGGRSAVRIFIDYELPAGWLGRLLGRLLGGLYARWCTEKMAQDAARHFRRLRRT